MIVTTRKYKDMVGQIIWSQVGETQLAIALYLYEIMKYILKDIKVIICSKVRIMEVFINNMRKYIFHWICTSHNL